MATFHVSPSGSDANDGKSWHTAVATIQRAIALSREKNTGCDTIVLGPGVFEFSAFPPPIWSGGTVIVTPADPAPDFTFSPWRKAYTLQPNSWLAPRYLLGDCVWLAAATGFNLWRGSPAIDAFAATGVLAVAWLTGRSLLEIRRRLRARGEGRGK